MAGIFYAIQHASYRYFDPEGYARFGLAFDQRILEAIQGLWLNVLHLHGDRLIFDVVEALPFPVVNWHARTAVCGGLRREATLVLGTPEAVRHEAQDAMQSMDGRGMILGAGCVVPTIAPRANLVAARRSVDFA